MKKVLALVTILALGTAAGATVTPAQTSDPAVLAEQIQSMTIEAAAAGDDEALLEAVALAERGVTVHPGDALLHHYHGYALYRLAARHACDEEADPRCVWDLLERAESALEASAEREPMAETHALLASVYGLMIGESPSLGASLGSRIDGLQSDALAMGPENPRVWLLKGIGDFYTPEAYGGGAEPALAALERSARAFETDVPVPPRPRWGRADVHVWLGQVRHAKGDTDEARRHYARALELEPSNAWVRDHLLPALDAAD
ncbi:MAG: tetratricopeptide repeat protein [Gemmatimonadota bacterium]